MARKTFLTIRYPDDPEKVWIALEREGGRREREPLTGEQQLYGKLIRWGAIALIVAFLCLLVSCEATSIIKALT